MKQGKDKEHGEEEETKSAIHSQNQIVFGGRSACWKRQSRRRDKRKIY